MLLIGNAINVEANVPRFVKSLKEMQIFFTNQKFDKKSK